MNRNGVLRMLLGIAGMTGIAAPAIAWDPNAGAEPISAYNRPSSAAPNGITAQRYYSSQGLTPLPPAANYAPSPVYTAPAAPLPPAANAAITPPPSAPAGFATYQPIVNIAPAPVTPAPIVNAAPYPAIAAPPVQPQPAPIQAAAIPVQPAPVVAQPPAPPLTTQIAYADPAAENNAIRSSAPTRGNRYSVGAELFYDEYKEPDTFPDLRSTSYYGAINASVTHDFPGNWFGGLDGRVSYGSEDYKSNSGTINGVPQWELESRAIAGYSGLFGGSLRPYAGLGLRYFLDQSGGKTTSLGSVGYDRSIVQLYAPIGVSYAFTYDDFTFTPNVELDPLLYGYVESRLSTIAGYEDAKNIQDSGLGWRAEFMVSKLKPNGTGWQFGPFVRYWAINDSNADNFQTPTGPGAGIEPKNTRLQLGTKLKYLF